MKRACVGIPLVTPFYFSFNDSDCGYTGFTFSCIDGDSRSVLNVSNDLYYIQDYDSQSLRVVGVDVEEEECPQPRHNFTSQLFYPFNYFYNCSSGYPKDVGQQLPCLDTYSNNNTSTPTGLLLRSFAFSSHRYGNSTDDTFNWYRRNCQENVVVPALQIYNDLDLNESLKGGFNLRWSKPDGCMDCEESGGKCWFNQTTARVHHHACSCPQHGTNQRKIFDQVCPPIQNISQPGSSQQNGVSIQLKILLGVCSGIGGLLLVALFVCRRKLFLLYGSTLSHWNSKTTSSASMEAFLESCGCPGLQRYTFLEVKKMTNTFNEKLGQGGFGSVFKGKLPDSRLVAVKLLDESKGNGEDFMNEVATIGSTNHVNVVRLLGFCCNGNKRALVYEFMPNGSLEKFIHSRENTSITNPPLGWEKFYQIALGIAKGLEYLHCGCNNRILHFDIKPHNILLGQDFCPKISDFGLAKLCQTRESIVSMQVVRGTIGYIAPEVYCRNFGEVSNKSDVYSYGMMILEMIGGRKTINATTENISEIYFPKWIYNHLKKDIDVGETKEFYTEEITKKMIMVALWCIQPHPSDRPSISKVVEMLEGNVDELRIPPNAFQGSPSRASP